MQVDSKWDDPKPDAKDDILTLEQIVIRSTHDSFSDTETMDTLLLTDSPGGYGGAAEEEDEAM